MNECKECKYRQTPRDEGELKEHIVRINRMKGQLDGIKTMLEENRYCGDVLVQVAAVESALRSLGYLILETHLSTCVSDKIRRGEDGVIQETIALVKKLS